MSIIYWHICTVTRNHIRDIDHISDFITNGFLDFLTKVGDFIILQFLDIGDFIFMKTLCFMKLGVERDFLQ